MKYRFVPERIAIPSLKLIAVFAVAFLFVQTLSAQSLTRRDPEITKAAKFDISPPLRTLKPNLSPKAKKAEDDQGEQGPVGDTRHDPDGALQSSTGEGIFSGISSFTGLGVSFDGMGGLGSTPPDPNGDIGPNHYVQMVNARFQIFNRSGVSVFGPANINTLFAGFGGPCQTENAGDPVVIYDQLADRWLLSQFSDSSGPFFNCVALSTTGDPTGTYYRYAFEAPTFPDYPKYAVWSDGYYLNTRESGGGVLGMYALERVEMLVGNPNARVVRFTVAETGSGGPNGLLNADIDGSVMPPPGSPNYLIGTRDDGFGAPSDALLLYKYQVDWTNVGNSTLTGPTVLPIAPFDSIFPCTPTSRACIPQPQTTTKIDILSYRRRPTFRLTYRNFGTHESLVTSQSVEGSEGIAGMRWWEVRSPNTTPVVHQEGTYAPGATDSIHRWMGSIAMDKQGNMALGYSVSNATDVFPGIRFTGRLVTDPLGQMAQGEGTIINGGGSQLSSGNRWGDYSSINVDSTDDCTFWYTQQYYATTSTTGYKTRVASFKFPGCTAVQQSVWADFDGDRKTDLSIFRPGPSEWWYLKSSNGGNASAQFGASGDQLTPGDYTGDGKSDFAVWRPSNGTWYVLRSEDFSFYSFPFGANSDIPVPADFDGDGKTDAAVYRPSTSTWFITNSGGGTTIQNYGSTGDIPVPADYDGDGRTDLAIYRPSVGQWWLQRTAAGLIVYTFGTSTDKLVPGDYTGDGKHDVAFYRPANGEWFILRSEDQSFYSFQFGTGSDIPAPGDYDGDGKFDSAVFRPSNTTWYVNRSTSGIQIQQFGIASDVPVPGAFVR
ncbi:MAG: VCBS repeat-containing protein [Pyrinomonadaceae bacterium]|nr:VCBS repeat-containing protein [Pyrinomonadaceae bacterium]